MKEPEQEFFTNIKSTTYSCNQLEGTMERPSLSTTMDEADMQLWLQCVDCTGSKVLLEYVFHGCKCKTGCHTRRYECKKDETTCRPGCQCIGCSNTPANAASNDSQYSALLGDDKSKFMLP